MATTDRPAGVALDEIDKAIIRELQVDGRMALLRYAQDKGLV